MKGNNPVLLCLLLLAAGRQQGCFSPSVKKEHMNIIGQWIKVSQAECSEKYPERIEFKPNGIYQAQASARARMHPVWDAGTFEVAGNAVKLSTSNDAVISYPVKMKDETISFTDPGGCTTQYKRM